MRSNLYLNFVITLLLVVIVGGVIFLVNSFDRMRHTFEKSSKNIELIREDINKLKENVLNAKFAATQNNVKAAPVKILDVKNIANYQYFNQQAPVGGILKTATDSETSNLNYLIQNESQVSNFWGKCNSALATRDYETPEKFMPLIADSWHISDDKLTYHIKIKKGVLWHDFTDPVSGKRWLDKEVTSEDFKFYVDVIKNKDVNCPQIRTYFKALNRIEILNDYEFKVYWDKKYFKTDEMTLGLMPFPKHLYHAYSGKFDGKKFNEDAKRNSMIIGCGPYYLAEVQKGRRYIFKRFEKYFGREYGIMPKIEELVYNVVKLPNTRLQMMKSQSLDLLGLNADQWKNHTKSAEFDVKTGFLKKVKAPGRSYSYIAWNLQNELFRSKKVRRAMTHLVNRDYILKFVYNNLARITTGPFVIDSPFYDKSIKPINFSIAKALQILALEGWQDTDGDGILDKNGKNFEFTFMIVSASETQKKISEIIKEDMRKVGIKMNILPIEWSVFIDRINKKKFDACTLGWTATFEPDPYQIWHSSQADVKQNSSNFISFKNKEADKLIEQIRVTFDIEKRADLCKKFHRLISDEQPYTFMMVPNKLFIYNKRLQNVRTFPLDVAPTDIMWIENK
ncbi:ABC transporter substrate-binding protein [Lentisphaerota bacterium WC36G]|nr:ABC transporter substrate-binding protein [Lentisphaerae bacterium WC36]